MGADQQRPSQSTFKVIQEEEIANNFQYTDQISIPGKVSNLVADIDLDKQPYKLIGFLTSEIVNESEVIEKLFLGSGVLVSSNLVLTCATNIWPSLVQEKKSTSIYFTLNMKDKVKRTVLVEDFFIPQEFKNAFKGYGLQKKIFDFALLKIKPIYEPKELTKISYMKFSEERISENADVFVCGYDESAKSEDNSQKMEQSQQMEESQKIQEIQKIKENVKTEKLLKQFISAGKVSKENQIFLHYSASTALGLLGSPILIKKNEKFQIVGLHRGGLKVGQRLNSYGLTNLQMKEYLNKWSRKIGEKIKIEPFFDFTKEQLTDLQKWKEDIHAAEDHYQKMEKQSLDAICNKFIEKYPDSQAVVKLWIKQQPQNYLAKWWYSFLIGKQQNAQRYKQELQILEKVVELKPDFGRVYNTIGYLHSKLGKADESERCYKKCIELNPRCHPAYNNIGCNLRDKGEYTEAITWFLKCIEIYPTYELAFNNLSDCYKKLKEYDMAIKKYQEFIEVNPEHPYAYNKIADIWREQKKYDEAIEWDTKYIEASPKGNHIESCSGLGLNHCLKKQHEKSIYWWKRCAELDPKKQYINGAIGEQYQYLNDHVTANIYFLREFEVNPKSQVALESLAKNYETLGNDEKAIHYLKLWEEVNPEEEDHQIMLEKIKNKSKIVEGEVKPKEEGMKEESDELIQSSEHGKGLLLD